MDIQFPLPYAGSGNFCARDMELLEWLDTNTFPEEYFCCIRKF